MEEKRGVADERPKLEGVGAARRQNLEVTVPSIGWKSEKILACERSCGLDFCTVIPGSEVSESGIWRRL